MIITDQTIIDYVAYCPSCGFDLDFGVVRHQGDMRCVSASCPSCSRKWSMIFDIDVSGTFGVMSFQCDNGDREIEI